MLFFSTSGGSIFISSEWSEKKVVFGWNDVSDSGLVHSHGYDSLWTHEYGQQYQETLW